MVEEVADGPLAAGSRSVEAIAGDCGYNRGHNAGRAVKQIDSVAHGGRRFLGTGYPAFRFRLSTSLWPPVLVARTAGRSCHPDLSAARSLPAFRWSVGLGSGRASRVMPGDAVVVAVGVAEAEGAVHSPGSVVGLLNLEVETRDPVLASLAGSGGHDRGPDAPLAEVRMGDHTVDTAPGGVPADDQADTGCPVAECDAYVGRGKPDLRDHRPGTAVLSG